MEFRLRKDLSRRVPASRPQAEQDAEELAYWLSRPPAERVAAVGFITQRWHRMRHGRELPRLDKTVSRKLLRHDA